MVRRNGQPSNSGRHDGQNTSHDSDTFLALWLQAYNLCYSTLVAGEDKKRLNPDQYLTSPTGDVFVKSEVRFRGHCRL